MSDLHFPNAPQCTIEELEEKSEALCEAAGHPRVVARMSVFDTISDAEYEDGGFDPETGLSLEDIEVSPWVVNNVLGEVAFFGPLCLSYQGYGEGEFRKKLSSPTWGDLLIAANEALMMTGDGHHVYFEGIDDEKVTEHLDDGTPVVRLVMGS